MNYVQQHKDLKAGELTDKQRARQYLSNKFALGSIMAEIAEGTKLTDIAARLNVDYASLYSVLTSTHKERYKAARAAFSESLAEKNLAMADAVEDQTLPADAAKAASGIRHWYMERVNPEQWGNKSTVDMNLKGVVGLHLEAIRQLADEPLEGEYEEVGDGRDDLGSSGNGDSDSGHGMDTHGLDDHPLL